MSDAKKILDMIEGVDHNDADALDKIDVLVFCFINNETLKEWRPEEFEFDVMEHKFTHVYGNFEFDDECQQYTRSRDALKAIRPDGWVWGMNSYSRGDLNGRALYEYKADNGSNRISSPSNIKTEELAELHAIIQAIEWERNNDQN